MGNLHKNVQLMLFFPQGSMLGPTLLLLYINDLICNISISEDDTILYSTCDPASDLRR